MTITTYAARILLAVYLFCVALMAFGVSIPGIVVGIVALIAALAVLVSPNPP